MDPLTDSFTGSALWTFEYNKVNAGYDQGNQVVAPFSESLVKTYLEETHRENFYCCLQYNPTEEAVYVYGASEALVIETRLIMKEKINTFVLQSDGSRHPESIVLKHFPDWEEEMTVLGYELFTSKMALHMLVHFYTFRRIPESYVFSEKAYLFPV